MSIISAILSYISWIVGSLVRPICLLSLILLLANPSSTYRKIQLFIISLQYLLFCNDKKWKKTNNPEGSALDMNNVDIVDKKTVIFVRHGESTWNDTFNKGDRSKLMFAINFIPNVLWSAFVEYYLFVFGYKNESWFFDSPLSEKGKGQANGICNFLRTSKLDYMTPREKELMLLLLGHGKDGEEPSSQLLSSNLRRAISTIAIGFQDRLMRNNLNASSDNDNDNSIKDEIVILPQLQEISRNPDALAITPCYKEELGQEKNVPTTSWTDPIKIKNIITRFVNMRLHTGNKPVNTNGLKRLNEFCHLIFNNKASTAADISSGNNSEIKFHDNLIVGGHSLWFRSFFRTYLPNDYDHISKRNKLVNGGCVGFTLLRCKIKKPAEKDEEEVYHYVIDPKSITVLYLGFQ